MGKSLIIKGGNFAENGISDLATYVDISASIVKSGTMRQYLHYPEHSVNEAFMYVSSASTTRVCTINVSAYVGKRLRLYASDSAVYSDFAGGAWWKCFASAISVNLPWTGTSTVQNVVTAVQHISGKGDATRAIWFDLIVPQGAVYLVFSNSDTSCPIPKVYVAV